MKEDCCKDYKVGENRFILSDDNILCIISAGDIEDYHMTQIKEVMFNLLEINVGKTNILIDLNRAGKPSAKARREFSNILETEKVGNVAVFGTHPVARVMASFVMGITKKKNMCFFKSKEEALTWLKEAH